MTKVRTVAKKRKGTALRSLIDKQKKAAPAAQDNVKDLDLTAAGADITSADKEQTKNTILFFKEELLAGVREGIDSELKSLDSETRQRLEASGLIEELYAGLKSGVTDELKKYVNNSNKSLITSFDSIVETLANSIESMMQPPLMQTVPGTNEQPLMAPIPVPKQTREQPRSIQELSRAEQEKVSAQILERGEVVGEEPTTRGGKIRNFLERAALGSVGLAQYAEKRIEKRQNLNYQVEIETKTNQQRFEGMTQREIRKTIETEQLQQQEVKKKLSKNEAQVSQLRRAGYSEADIEKIGLGAERETLLKEAVVADPSRLGKEYTLPLSTPKTSDEDTTRTESVLKEEQVRKETLLNTEINQKTNKDYLAKTSTTSISEESQYEQSIKEEQVIKSQEEQVILLSDIREILQQTEKARAEKQATSPAGGDGAGTGVPDIDIDINRIPKPSRTPTPKSAKPSVLQRLGTLARGPAALFAAKAAAVGAAGYAGYKAGEWLNENVINPGITSLTDGKETSLGGAIYSGVDKLQDMAGGWLGKSDTMKMREAEEAAKIQIQKRRTEEQAINIREGATPPRTGDRLATKMTDEKAEGAKPIIVNAPPPTIINNSANTKEVAAPFTTGLRNGESSISAYLKTRY